MTELDDLKKYILSESSEKAKDYLVFPLFKKLFGNKFKKESDAEGADIYIEGKLIVELKSDTQNFLPGFYQALHYEKKGLSFSAACVITRKFIGLWKLKDLPKEVRDITKKSDALKAPNEIGVINARKTGRGLEKEILDSAFYLLTPSDLDGFFEGSSSSKLNEFVQVLRNLDTDRIQIAPHNFISKIELMKEFFEKPIEAIHCFYAVVGYWNATSKVIQNDETELLYVHDFMKNKISEPLTIRQKYREKFKKLIESHYVFTNEGSGKTVDYYFSRFDEVITKLNPEYAVQHGIFFTDHNLSKFALWFVHNYFEKKLSDKYIVLDPAGGSGNLVTSWRGHLKHKIVSELQPDLLKTIERRMKLDSEEVQTGFTVIPKTSENKGLNFINISAEEYLEELSKGLSFKNTKLDKPIAFLLNPPYKNTDENVSARIDHEAEYDIHPSILEMTGNDAGKERYLAFLAQIVNIAKLQMGDAEIKTLNFANVTLPKPLDKNIKETPLLLIFTPTSWLIPRPTYQDFRKEFDKYFKYEDGLIVLGNEFFKIKGRFPISFTIWSYNYNEKGNKNKVKVRDFTHLNSKSLDINWNSKLGDLNKDLSVFVRKAKTIRLDNSRGEIKSTLPLINVVNGDLTRQPMYDFKRDATKTELTGNNIFGGLPLSDERRKNKKTYGAHLSNYIGLMDDFTPVRIKKDNYNRMTNCPDRVWFRLDSAIADINKSVCVNLPTPVKSYCAYDLESAKATFSWFAISKAVNGRYPIWANQYDIWQPKITKELEKDYYALCFAFGLAENRCVVTKFEKDNPVAGAEEIFVDNPLCPTNREAFWLTAIEPYLIGVTEPKAILLIELIKQLYELWQTKYCTKGIMKNVGLENEPYFKYFDYADFLMPSSGLIQIRKYADINGKIELIDLFKQINEATKDVKENLYKMLVEDFKYFE